MKPKRSNLKKKADKFIECEECGEKTYGTINGLCWSCHKLKKIFMIRK